MKSKRIAAQCYYGKLGFSNSSDQIVCIFSGLCFKMYHSNNPLYFYGDTENCEFVRKVNRKTKVYDRIDDTTINRFIQNHENSENYFNASKFAVIDDVCAKQNASVILFDTDLIPNINFDGLLNQNDICYTHPETLDPTAPYPGYEILRQKNSLIPEYKDYCGMAFNTSILGIADPEIGQKYVDEAIKFMAFNGNPDHSDCLYVEQILLPVLAQCRFHIKSVPVLKDIVFCPKTGRFKAKDWHYDQVSSLYDPGVMHLWIRKKYIEEDAAEREQLISDLCDFMKKEFPDVYPLVKAFLDDEGSCE